ncbi:MAG: MATE family efflux transporter, partial [Solobacterium sp.]|nr:MATE family efflux transporter [Solobacterium sp.]
IRDRHFYRRVLTYMLPVALQQAINMGVNMLDTMMLGSFGEIQLSASSLANQFYNFFTIFCMGIIGGASVLSAQYWGAGDKDKVR